MSDMGFQVFVGSICFELREFDKYLTFFRTLSLLCALRCLLSLPRLSKSFTLFWPPSNTCCVSHTFAVSLTLLLFHSHSCRLRCTLPSNPLPPRSCFFPSSKPFSLLHPDCMHISHMKNSLQSTECPINHTKAKEISLFRLLSMSKRSKILTNLEHNFGDCLNCSYLDVNCPIYRILELRD